MPGKRKNSDFFAILWAACAFALAGCGEKELKGKNGTKIQSDDGMPAFCIRLTIALTGMLAK